MMPSDRVSRRRLLELGGVGTAALGGGVAGWFADDVLFTDDPDLPPVSPFLFDETAWQYPRYDAANTAVAPAAAAPEEPLSRQWHESISATRWCRLAVSDGQVYAGYTFDQGSNSGQRFVALSSLDGTVQWEYTLPNWDGNHTPIVADGTVFYDIDGDEGEIFTAMATSDGSQQWVETDEYHVTWVYGGYVFIGSSIDDETVQFTAFDRRGRERWATEVTAESLGQPSANAEGLYWPVSGEETRELYVLDCKTGDVTNQLQADVQSNSPVRGGVIFTETNPSSVEGSIAALDVESGGQLWEAEQRDLDQGTGRGRRTVEAVTEDAVFELTAWSGQFTDSIRAYDVSSGNRQWTIHPESETDTTITLTPPVIAGSRLYCVATQNTGDDEQPSELRVYDVNSGTLQSTHSLQGGSTSKWSPVVAGGQIFTATTAGIEAFT